MAKEFQMPDVPVFIPEIPGAPEEENFVIVTIHTGEKTERYKIMRGVQVYVPWRVSLILDQSTSAQKKAAAYSREMQRSARTVHE